MGFTAREYARTAGVAICTARKHIRRLVDDNKVKFVGKRAVYGYDGSPHGALENEFASC